MDVPQAHSERLGDAFEYLLSVLGTQGDAGQFRTPRHIIDFIVTVVDPTKNDTVLDPACGTAGFLISAFKNILNGGAALTPDERARLMTNFRGYDIAPDMVRLSRVNLYLHGFANPTIHEYDTLTSEERWDERCDLIMANPPFMTPKGGIRPHNRFSIKAKRSEVLFVDYIAEHLTPSGRAGVIVPEGIIFQGQNAYKNLRRMLVEGYLWAVVSLPAGVFNPYSGVKTSILFMDRNLVKRTDHVLFVKIENDGFDLGAQRRPIEGGQLAEALAILERHKTTPEAQEGKLALTVPRSRLLESPDINLSGDRYRTVAVRHSGKWPMVPIGQLCGLQNGRAFKPTDWEKKEAGGMPIIRIQNLNNPKAEFNFYSGKVDDRLIVRRGDLLFSWSGSRGTSFGPHIWDRQAGILNQHILNVRHNETIERWFFYWMLKKAVEQVEENLHGGVGLVHITKGNLESIEVPLPPLEEQERIVAELEGYRKVIEGARQVLASYKPTIRVDPAWTMVSLQEIITLASGDFLSEKNRKVGPYRVYGGNGVTGLHDHFNVEKPTIVIGRVGAYCGSVHITDSRAWVTDNALHVKAFLKHCDILYMADALRSLNLNQFAKVGGQPSISQATVLEQAIPLPPLSVQREIVAELEAERKLVEANRELIRRMEGRIKAKLDEVWGG